MKKLTRLAAILASTAILFSAISCKTDDGNSGGEETNADGTTTLKINENDKSSGFVSAFSTDGTTTAKINTANVTGYEGSGYLDNPGKVIYSVNSETAQDVEIQIRYAHWGWTYQIKAAYVQINGVNYLEEHQILYGNWTGKNNLSLTNTIKVPLKAGDNQICLLPVQKGTSLPKYDDAKGYGVKYQNGEADETESVKAQAAGKVAGPYLSDGMIPNFDYITIKGKGIKNGTGQSANYYQVKVSVNNSAYGSIEFSPEQDSYIAGTEVTVTATPAEGYIFDSWCGTSKDKTGSFTVKIDSDKTFKANFISASYNKETELSGLEGYASVCDDDGTAYTITGGFGGEEITIASYADLLTYKSKISGNDPAIIKVTARISSAEWIDTAEYNKELAALTASKGAAEAKFILKNRSFTFDIGSNKTILGEIGKDYGFKNINPKIIGTNVIVKYLHFGDVIGDDYFGGTGTGNDALSIKGGQHVWIDHCEFSSSLTPKEVDGTDINFSDHKFPVDLEGEDCTEKQKWTKDFYDGLLDVSETSRFVSISNSYFHDHWKACLCGGSNDKAESQPQGSQVRMTMYNNYFENIHSRQPLFRFGRAHIYSSYLKGAGSGSDATGIEVRAESRVYVDNVYFENIHSDKTVGCWNSSSGLGEGKWTVKGCEGASISSNAGFTPPYNWTKTSASDSKANLPTSAGISK